MSDLEFLYNDGYDDGRADRLGHWNNGAHSKEDDLETSEERREYKAGYHDGFMMKKKARGY